MDVMQKMFAVINNGSGVLFRHSDVITATCSSLSAARCICWMMSV